jgi:hypothetical protein
MTRAHAPLIASPDAIAAVADDFGHLIHRVPALVAGPRDADEIVSVVRYAEQAGLPVVPRGCGHSVYGQAQSDGGIVCDLTGLDRVFGISPSGISVGAGARWSSVLAATARNGLTPPVLTDYLELTVGGTLSAGGIGGASHQHGPQVDHVRELDVITGDGHLITCSASEDPDVFFGALAGYGRNGIITRAQIPLIPAPGKTRVYRLTYRSLGALVADQIRLATERFFGYLEGQIVADGPGQWRFVLEAAAWDHDAVLDGLAFDGLQSENLETEDMETEDMEYGDFCHRMTPGVRSLAATGDWYRPHPWLSVFLPVGAVERYVSAALAGLTPGTLGPVPMLLYPLRRGAVPAPGLVTPSRDELFYSFSILRTTVDADDALTHNKLLDHEAVAAGGAPYPISAVPISAVLEAPF